MKTRSEVIDLRNLTHTAVFYEVKDLRPGDTIEILINENPKLLMEAVNLQTRNLIAWEVLEHDNKSTGPEEYLVRVRYRHDVAPMTLTDLLVRDHETLDLLFGEALNLVNEGDTEAAKPLVERYDLGLKRHVYAENEVVAPALELEQNLRRSDPTSVMIDEHDSLIDQLRVISDSFAFELPEGWEVAPLLALMSGALAKHEGREENNLFPMWEVAVKHGPEGLFERVVGILQGTEDEAVIAFYQQQAPS